MFGHPHTDLFAIRTNAKLTLYMPPVPNPIAWKQDALQHHWNDLSAYMPPPSLADLVEIDAFNKSLHDFSSSSLASERVVHRSVGSFGGGTSQAPLAVESSGAIKKWHMEIGRYI